MMTDDDHSLVTYREVVQLLLAHEASTNILDVKGSSPLHLAAWTGNVDIVRLLLCHGPSVPNVNLTVSTAQFGNRLLNYELGMKTYGGVEV
jgi:ankyrin repeat protein